MSAIAANCSSNEIDTHADTCYFGSNSLVVEYTGKHVDVTPFPQNLGKLNQVLITSRAVAYDDPVTMQTYTMVFHQALYMADRISHSLINPMQLRMAGHKYFECPKHLCANPTEQDHSIQCHDLSLQLALDGVISYFDTRKPSFQEYETVLRSGSVIDMTSQTPWEPYSQQFATEELRAANHSVSHQNKPRSLSTVSRVMSSLSRALADVDSLANALEENVRISYKSFVSSARSVNKRGAVNAERLADLWNIGIETAKKTLEHTTQGGNRLFTNSKMTKRLKSTVDQLKFRQLSCIM